MDTNEIVLTNENFDSEVTQSDKPVLVDFWAPWCGPCLVIAPFVAEIAAEYKDKIKVGKVNVDQNDELQRRFNIMSIPNLKVFKSGKVVGEISGAAPKQAIVSAIEANL